MLETLQPPPTAGRLSCLLFNLLLEDNELFCCGDESLSSPRSALSPVTANVRAGNDWKGFAVVFSKGSPSGDLYETTALEKSDIWCPSLFGLL